MASIVNGNHGYFVNEGIHGMVRLHFWKIVLVVKVIRKYASEDIVALDRHRMTEKVGLMGFTSII